MSSKPKVRRATAGDAETLARLLRQFNDEYEEETPDHDLLVERIEALMESGVGAFFMAGDAEGFAYLAFYPSLYTREHETYLGELYVEPASRGRGMGREMLDVVLSEARSRGSTHIQLNTSVTDTEARSLYESVGFTNLEGGEKGPSMLYYELDL